MKDYEKELELLRYRFWTEVYNNGDINFPDSQKAQADNALKAFDARFMESRNCNNCHFFIRNQDGEYCYEDAGRALFISDPGSHVCREFVPVEKR